MGRSTLSTTETTVHMSHEAAYSVLKKLRADMCTHDRITTESRDLTDGVDFNWRAYLAIRTDRGVIIGKGLARVEARFLSVRDPTCLSLSVPNQFDFVFHRTDGSIARVHPEATQPGRVVVHERISECVIWGSRADDILPLYGIPPEDAFNPAAASRGLTLPQNDRISAKQAWAWLMRNVDLNPAAPAMQPPSTAPAASRGLYVNWIDLYDAKRFRWRQFWMAQWGPVDYVSAFGAVRWGVGDGVEPTPRFVAGMTGGKAGVISFRVRRCQGPTDQDMVKAIWDWVDVEPAARPPAAPAAPRGFEPEVGQDGAPPPPLPGIGPQTRQPPPPPPPPRRARPNGGGVAADADPGATSASTSCYGAGAAQVATYN